MPSGYTSTLHDGEQTFAEYAMGCARAFGALIMMRDAASDAEVPEAFEPQPFYAESLNEAREKLAALQAMSQQAIETAAERDFNENHERWAQRQVDAAAIKDRYTAMLAEVESWEPPTGDHEGLKTLMRDQLVESIRFDTSTDWDEEPQRRRPEQWHAEQIERAQRNVQQRQQSLVDEIRRAAERTAWVRALRASLPQPALAAALDGDQ